jgi:hypothetical protein
MLARIRARLVEISHADLTLSRLTVALGSLAWSGILLFGGEQFERPSYVYLREVAPQWVWGAAFGVCGFLQIWRVARGVPVTSGIHACVVAGVIAWMWSAISVALALSLNPPPAMVSGNIAIAIIAGVIFIRTVARRG